MRPTPRLKPSEVVEKARAAARSKPTSTREEILRTGISLTTGDRQKQYGEAYVNMRHFGALLSAYFMDKIMAKGNGPNKEDTYSSYFFSPEDAAQIMVLAKASRIAGVGPYHKDNYIDQATYSAIAGECREKQ